MKIEKDDKLTKSKDLLEENIQNLKQLFPEAFTEDKKIDFESLKNLLGEYVEKDKERYSFNWAGKQQARREAQKVSTGTLRPCKEESVNFDDTENLYIEGDNLEVLKLLQKSYHNSIKMIYIDPPYNTGKDFVYKDNYHDNLKNYKEITGQIDSEGNKLSTNSDSAGRYHSNWLNMMYPRLKLARNLLKDDGVIFISIDDNEVQNLRKICDDIFGEENFVACLPTVMNLKGNNDQFGFAGTHELTTVYIKKKSSIDDLNGIPLDKKDIDNYTNEDSIGKFKQGATLMRTGEAGARSKRPKGFYPIYVDESLSKMSLKRNSSSDFEVFPKTVTGKEMSWRRSPKFLEETLSEFIIKKTSNGISFYKKQRLVDDMKKGKKPKSLFYKSEYSSGNGTSNIVKLFNDRIFDNPKPLNLIKDFLHIGLNSNDIILDFFSGSATTAHAVLDLNKEDLANGQAGGGNRKFIMVQLPEPTDEKSEAFKVGYKTIAEIGKERIRRVINKIKEEQDVKIDNLDLGFKVLKLDSSNIKAWDSETENLEEDLLSAVNNIKEDRNQDDLLYEIMLKYGLDLTLPVEEIEIAGNKVFSVGMGELICCLSRSISLDTVRGIGKLKEEINPENCRVVFMDNGFKDDVVKTNAMQILNEYDIEEVRSI
jgi:adenine-specific DNA-methyltransferase